MNRGRLDSGRADTGRTDPSRADTGHLDTSPRPVPAPAGGASWVPLLAVSLGVLGGGLTAAVSWRLVFAVNVPVGLAAWWLTRRGVASPGGAAGRRGDPLGQFTAIVALTALTAGLIEAGPNGWASWPVAAGLVIAAAGAAAFVAAQHWARSPMLPLALLRRPALSGGSVVGLLINLGFYGQLFAYSLYLRRSGGTPR